MIRICIMDGYIKRVHTYYASDDCTDETFSELLLLGSVMRRNGRKNRKIGIMPEDEVQIEVFK